MRPRSSLELVIRRARRQVERGEHDWERSWRKAGRKRESKRRNCSMADERRIRRNGIKTAWRGQFPRGWCIICRRVVRRFQLVFHAALLAHRLHEYGGETSAALNRTVQFFLIIRKSSLMRPYYLLPPSFFLLSSLFPCVLAFVTYLLALITVRDTDLSRFRNSDLFNLEFEKILWICFMIMYSKIKMSFERQLPLSQVWISIILFSYWILF